MNIKRKALTFSIVSHSNGELIRELLHDIRRTCKLDYEIIITINTPEDINFLSTFNDLPILVIHNKIIKGFGENHNQAFKRSNSDYFLVINPDIKIMEFDFESFLITFDDKKVAICGPKVIHSSGRIEDSPRKFPTIFSLIARRLFKKNQIDYLIGSNLINVDWIGGMFMVFSSKDYRNLEGFNEDFFMYLEDAEICREVKRINKTVVFNPNFSVIHITERKSRRNLKYFLIHCKSLWIFLFKTRKKN